jgi:hypothetical protein
MVLGSEIRDPEKTYSGSRIPDPGVKKAPDPGSGSATLLLTLHATRLTTAQSCIRSGFVYGDYLQVNGGTYF